MQQVQSQFSTPKYYKDQGGKYLGSYVLAEGVDTVLPTQPMPKGYLVKEMIESGASQDMEWHLHILIEDGSSPQGYKYLTTKDLKLKLWRRFQRLTVAIWIPARSGFSHSIGWNWKPSWINFPKENRSFSVRKIYFVNLNRAVKRRLF